MCKLNPKNDSRFIDPCMVNLINILNSLLPYHLVIKACCCGHRKYPMTIVIRNTTRRFNYELLTQVDIPRKVKFYKRDKQGYYYIPEVMKGGKNAST